MHQIKRILASSDHHSTSGSESSCKLELLQKINVLHYSAQRIVYGYKLYNMEDSVQLVFDAANYRVQDIIAEVKGKTHKRKQKQNKIQKRDICIEFYFIYKYFVLL